MKRLFLTVVSLFFVIGFTSCEPSDQTEDAYEINAIDKEEVEDPDDRGNS